MMDFPPLHFNTISMGLPNVHFKGSQVESFTIFLSLKVVFILANNAEPVDVQHYAAFHLGLYCLPKYPLRGFQCTMGEKLNSIFNALLHNNAF